MAWKTGVGSIEQDLYPGGFIVSFSLVEQSIKEKEKTRGAYEQRAVPT